jgi:hypothetical protein
MHHVPTWILNLIEREDLLCHQCNFLFKLGNLMSIGIQESSQKPHNDMLCIGMFCSKCQELTIFEIKEMNLLEFSFEIVGKKTEDKVRVERAEEEDDDEKEEKKRGVPPMKKPIRTKSKITSKEVQDSVRSLNAMKTHEEFLVAMGMSPEEIRKYDFKKEEINKENRKGKQKGKKDRNENGE